MPWKEQSVMDERMKFVAKLLDGESISNVCREFGISRKTGYKIYNRYKECGIIAMPPGIVTSELTRLKSSIANAVVLSLEGI